jgi:hypothetical protein
MKMALLAIAAWSLTAAATGQEKKAGAEAYDDFKEPYRTKFVESSEKAVNDTKHQVKSYPAERQKDIKRLTGKDKKAAIDEVKNHVKELTDNLARLEKNDPPFFPGIPVFDKWAVGSLGHVDNRLRAVQVLGKEEMLVDVVILPAWGEKFNQLLKFAGFATEGITDGAEFRIAKPVIVTKTTTYATAAGATNTVLVVEPLEQDSFKASAEEKAARRKNADEPPQKADQPTKKERDDDVEAAKWRTWTDASGEHKIEAKCSGLTLGAVNLAKRDGSKLKVSLEKLSAEDKVWIANRSKSRK